MKNWQYCMLTASIYAAPMVPRSANIVAVAVFLVLSTIEIVRER
jgi:hypothetical protein